MLKFHSLHFAAKWNLLFFQESETGYDEVSSEADLSEGDETESTSAQSSKRPTLWPGYFKQ